MLDRFYGESFFEQQLARVKSCDRKEDLDDYVRTFGEQAVESKHFYNIGAGRFAHPAWTNLDFSHPAYNKLHATQSAFIEYDLRRHAPLPIASDTACLFYTSHTIEHVRDTAVGFLFAECYRALRPGGVIRIVCPDLDLAYRAYRARDMRYFSTFTQAHVREGVLRIPGEMKYGKVRSIQRAFLIHFARQVSRMDTIGEESVENAVDRVFGTRSLPSACDFFTALCSDEEHETSPGDHINWFNYAKLESVLTRVGFRNVWRSGYGQSAYAVLRNRRYFDRTRPCFSLYVEALK